MWRGPFGQGVRFAVPSVALAMLAHLPSTGPTPGFVPILFITVGLIALATGLAAGGRLLPTGRRPRLDGPVGYAVAVTTQAGLHGLLAMSASPRTSHSSLAARLLCHPPGTSGTALGRLGNPGAEVPGRTAGSAAGNFRATIHSAGWTPDARGLIVLSAHMLAAAGVLWWLRHGSAAARAVIRLLSSQLSPPVAPVTIAASTRGRPVGRRRPSWLPMVCLRYVLARRGPPRLPALAAVPAAV
ncbi:hypothetical protein [Frankia sp. Cas3]|uniref:hypothetical protein n=1 Tax=Frankia sp. Cas3 TaxID=3073926 RepID=UPI002AD32623|nr:hypothetical protein [Frankia sp. Cas3]